jgi:hypothetical protein
MDRPDYCVSGGSDSCTKIAAVLCVTSDKSTLLRPHLSTYCWSSRAVSNTISSVGIHLQGEYMQYGLSNHIDQPNEGRQQLHECSARRPDTRAVDRSLIQSLHVERFPNDEGRHTI